MELELQPGRYVVAVSGGVDSVTLLDLLTHVPGVQLIVAHYDHGIREDSIEDRKYVSALAKKYGLPFIYDMGRLGPTASEAKARRARYDFLHHVKKVSQATAIITAHHEDDVLETIILNLLRGTNRKGLHSLRSTSTIKRPLLKTSKSVLKTYAQDQGLVWHEDSTNSNDTYLRNHIRLHIMPRINQESRAKLLQLSDDTSALNQEIETSIVNYLHVQPATNKLERHDFIMLPYAVAREIMASWLRLNTEVELSKSLLDRLVVAAQNGRNGSRVDVDAAYWLHISKHTLALMPRDR